MSKETSKEMSKEMSFEEYCEREYSGLKVLLSGFPEEEIKAYWDSRMDFIKSAYKTKSRIAYGLALAF
ncbi:MAG: hypothetical protein IJ706_03065 [Clostridia bacterium]|nr:hypothetical protein [Clostridia bacterium]